MLSKLPPRERQIVDILYERGALAVADICEALPDALSGSAVRAMLKRLEDKGFVPAQRIGARLSLQPGGVGLGRQEIGAERDRSSLLQRIAGERGQRPARDVGPAEGE